MLRAVVLASFLLGLGSPVWAQTECDHAWTFGANMTTLRDGVNVGGLGAAAAAYRCHQGDVYVLGVDQQWWKYNGNSTWSLYGAQPPAFTLNVNESAAVVGASVFPAKPDAAYVWPVQSRLYINGALSRTDPWPFGAETAVPVSFATAGTYVVELASYVPAGSTLPKCSLSTPAPACEVKAMAITVKVGTALPPPVLPTPKNLVVQP